MPGGRYRHSSATRDTDESPTSSSPASYTSSCCGSYNCSSSRFSAASSATNLTRPSRTPPFPTLPQQIAAVPLPRASYALPCEFAAFMGCTRTYDPIDVDGWIRHHVEHLRGRFPRIVKCLVCEEHVFNCDVHKVDPESNFYNRMDHIADDLSFAGRLIPFRIDFFMLDHLKREGLFNPEELPYEMNSKDHNPIADGAIPHNGMSKHQTRKADRENRVIEVNTPGGSRRKGATWL